MALKRKFEVAGFAAIAILSAAVLYVLGFLLAPFVLPPASEAERAAEDLHRDAVDPPAYAAQLQALRELRHRALTATTPQTREAVAIERGRVMSAGVNMMLRMRSALPASVSATGEMTSEPITELEAQRVQDFLVLVELLAEMKSYNGNGNDNGIDTGAGTGNGNDPSLTPGAPHRAREVESIPMPNRRDRPDSSLVHSGTGSSQSGLLV